MSTVISRRAGRSSRVANRRELGLLFWSSFTINVIVKELQKSRPSSLRLATLLDRPARREITVDIDFTGFVIPDRFVIGYGLDYAGLYRELPGIYCLG